MSVIKGICSAIKEDKVNEWLKDNNRKIDISGDKWSEEELELFEREKSNAEAKIIEASENIRRILSGVIERVLDKELNNDK